MILPLPRRVRAYLPPAEPRSGRPAPPGSSASRDESWPKRRSALAAAGPETHHTGRFGPVRAGLHIHTLGGNSPRGLREESEAATGARFGPASVDLLKED